MKAFTIGIFTISAGLAVYTAVSPHWETVLASLVMGALGVAIGKVGPSGYDDKALQARLDQLEADVKSAKSALELYGMGESR